MKIRYHHLMCIPRFVGKGYSDEFCRNMKKIKEKLSLGELPELCSECDDVCCCCPECVNGKCTSEEKVIRYDLAVKQALESGEIPEPKNICSDCKWYYICKDMEADNVYRSKLN